MPRQPVKEGRSFTKEVEARAHELVDEDAQKRTEPWLVGTSLLDDEIRLTLHQLQDTRARGHALLEDLLEAECDLGTELLAMEQRTPRYSPYRFPERQVIQRRRDRVQQERRRLVKSQVERVDALHVKLLELVGKRRVLTPSG